MDLMKRLGKSPAVEFIKDIREKVKDEESKLADYSSFVALVSGAYLGYCSAKSIYVDSGLSALLTGGPLVASFLGNGFVKGGNYAHKENLKELEEKYKKIDQERISTIINKYESTFDVQSVNNPNELEQKILDEICEEVDEKRTKEMELLCNIVELAKNMISGTIKKISSPFIGAGIGGTINSATHLGIGYTLGYCAGRFF